MHRALLAALLLAVVPAPAGAAVRLGYDFEAGTCSRFNCSPDVSRLAVSGDDGAQAIELRPTAGSSDVLVVVDDPEVAFSPHPSVPARCARVEQRRWRCDGTGSAIVRLGGGADRLTVVAELSAEVEGGPGDDVIAGGVQDDVLDGGDGADRVDGGEGDDLLRAGAGGERGDAVAGAGGEDTLAITSATGLEVDLGRGAIGGSGAVSGVEHVEGGPGPDRIAGDGGDNRLAGGGGDDTLEGGDGADHLNGGDGSDRLRGEGGADRLDPGSQIVERIEGGIPTGDAEGYTLDRVPDEIRCGAGRDRLVRPDARDVARAECEIVEVAVGADGLVVTGLHGRVRGGRLTVRVRCADATPAIRLRHRGRLLAGASDAACGGPLRLRVRPRDVRRGRTLDVTVGNGARGHAPARFRIRR